MIVGQWFVGAQRKEIAFPVKHRGAQGQRVQRAVRPSVIVGVLLSTMLFTADTATAQGSGETVGPPTAVGTISNSLVFSQFTPGDVTISIRQTVTPSHITFGERVRVVRESRFTLPSGDACITPNVSASTENFNFSYGVFLAGGEAFEDQIQSYRVGNGGMQFVHGPGMTSPAQIISTTQIDGDALNCHATNTLTKTAEFTPAEPGAFYLSLGGTSVSNAQFNGEDVPLSSVSYKTAGELPTLQVDPPDTETLKRQTDEQCTIKNAGDAKVPWREPRVYRQMRHDICVAAKRFGISPILLGVLFQHEGAGRTRLVQSSVDKWIEENINPFGKNETIGPGQMRPDLAAELSRDIDDRPLTESEARDKLAHDSVFAVNMAAAELAKLQARHGLDDRQAFIAYAGGTGLVPEFKRTNFNGPDAKPRGEKFDKLYAAIAGEDGFPEPTPAATW